ncbi:hypothetical protein AG1IA_10405 [Rhizoctonia solani AG-1 IA]|uniref:Secreted protein n=1 Tax=Thanatephorus cucumeris (strain AG1-IA) TaxID=983506 RepID=L8WC71_THACA|nr:hypothetical protein AG1IA_10405 [Rhizoctonia solani AG-1 IA]
MGAIFIPHLIALFMGLYRSLTHRSSFYFHRLYAKLTICSEHIQPLDAKVRRNQGDTVSGAVWGLSTSKHYSRRVHRLLS